MDKTGYFIGGVCLGAGIGIAGTYIYLKGKREVGCIKREIIQPTREAVQAIKSAAQSTKTLADTKAKELKDRLEKENAELEMRCKEKRKKILDSLK